MDNSRPRWTPEMHECFVEAVSAQGGASYAKPTAIMKTMVKRGFTERSLKQIKSHLQYYRIKQKQLKLAAEAEARAKTERYGFINIGNNTLCYGLLDDGAQNEVQSCASASNQVQAEEIDETDPDIFLDFLIEDAKNMIFPVPSDP